MGWYRTGSVAVTNGSPYIVGSGTAWVGNVLPGHEFVGSDGRSCEVLAVPSDTQITLVENYAGSTASGQPYKVIPTQGSIQTLVPQVQGLITTFSGIANAAGVGKFDDGTAGAPGVRFTTDSDTGIRRAGENAMALVAGGVDRLLLGASATLSVDTGIAKASPSFVLAASAAGQYALITFSTGTAARWLIGKTSGAESGANANSDFLINRYADDGGYLATAFSISRANGAVNIPGTLGVGGLSSSGSRTALGKDVAGAHWLRTADTNSEPNCLAYGFTSDGTKIIGHSWLVGGASVMRLDAAGNLAHALKGSAPAMNNSEVVMTLPADNTLRITVRGVDGVTRAVNLGLS